MRMVQLLKLLKYRAYLLSHDGPQDLEDQYIEQKISAALQRLMVCWGILNFLSIYCSSNVYQHWCHHQLFHLSTSAILSKIPERAPSLLRLRETDNYSVPNSRNTVWPLEELTDTDRY
jgi:hypothetical protein